MNRQKNVYGEDLELCSTRPLTGYKRTGNCETEAQDIGAHTVCVQVTRQFLDFSRSRGNDLVTPIPEFDFPGLQPGDRWCVCAERWKEALEADCAPKVVIRATHERVIDTVSMETLRRHAIDLS